MSKTHTLITGASAGIGKAFAEQLAEQGHNLVLVARRESQLKQLSESLSKQHNVDCHSLVADLSDPGANQTIFQHCQDQNWSVDYLINNAGYGIPGDFDSVEWQTHQDMLQVMLRSLVELCHLFYPSMKTQKTGTIINVASLAGLTPATAGHTLYGPLKAFVVQFTHGLHLEAVEHGIHVSALCPGFTYTEFHDVNGTRSMVSQMSKKMWLDADTVVAYGIEKAKLNQAIVVPGWRNRAIATLTKILPDRLLRWLIKGSVSKYRKR